MRYSLKSVTISRWYVQGSHCINLGLTMNMEMDSNPENWAETHNAACVRSGIMMRIRIVKSTRNDEELEDDDDNLPHGTKVLK